MISIKINSNESSSVEIKMEGTIENILFETGVVIDQLLDSLSRNSTINEALGTLNEKNWDDMSKDERIKAKLRLANDLLQANFLFDAIRETIG